jgi:hypothetical protein
MECPFAQGPTTMCTPHWEGMHTTTLVRGVINLSPWAVVFLDLDAVSMGAGASCSKRGQRAFHGGPIKQKPAPIFVLVN